MQALDDPEQRRRFEIVNRPDEEYERKKVVSWQILGECVLYIQSRHPHMAKNFPDEFLVILHHELDIMMHPSAPRCTVSYFKSAYSLLDGIRKIKKLVLNIILAVCCDLVLEVWYT